MKKLLLYTIVSLTAVLTAATACAQTAPYKFDVGAQLGMSGYLGEANHDNPFRHPGLTAEASFRYIINARMAVRGVYSVLGLSGNTADMTNVLPDNSQYAFTSTVNDLAARFEFNFLPYGIGETYKKLRRLSPYLTLGLGVSLSSSDGHSAVAPTLPMGFGLKFKLSKRLNLGAEFTMTKVFGHRIDGPWINNLNGIKTAFYRNTDWFSRLTIGISYEFGERCETCHYVD